MITKCIAASGAAAIISGAAGAVTITTDDGVGADAVVISTAAGADTNYGTINNMRIGANKGDMNAAIGYVRFDLAAVTDSVSEAELSFAVNFGTGAGNDWGLLQLFVLNDGDAGEGWSETGITWNTAPANAGTGTSMSSNATLLAAEAFDVRAATAGSIVSYSGTNLVDALNADTDGRITFIVVGPISYEGSTHPGLATREHSSHGPPTLSLTLVPEPGSLVVLAAGVPALMMRRRNAHPILA